MVVYAETALEKDAPAASDLAHQEVAGTSVQLNAICMYWDAYPSLGPSLGLHTLSSHDTSCNVCRGR